MSPVLTYHRRPPVDECPGFVRGAGTRHWWCVICGAKSHRHVSEPTTNGAAMTDLEVALTDTVVTHEPVEAAS